MWPFKNKAMDSGKNGTTEHDQWQDFRYQNELKRNLILKEQLPPHHYAFVHKTMRHVFQTMPYVYFERMMNDKIQFTNFLWEMTCEECGGKDTAYFTANDIITHQILINNHPTIVTIMPHPIIFTDAYMVAAVLVAPETSTQANIDIEPMVAYITLERAIGLGGIEKHFLCAWKGSEHVNLEIALETYAYNDFTKAVQYVLKERPDTLLEEVKIQNLDDIRCTIARFFPLTASPSESEIPTPQAQSEFVTVVNSTTKCQVNDPDIAGCYSGECVDGIAHGKGIAQGRDEYNGYFENGNKHGQGTYIWGPCSVWAGQVFVGESINDEMIKGVWTLEKEAIVKTGIFKDRKLNGIGTIKYANGTIEEGTFKDDELYGLGIVKIPMSLLPDEKETPTMKLIDNYWVMHGVFANGDYLMGLSVDKNDVTH